MSETRKKLYRSRDDRMIAGVCGGIGEYFDIDPTLVRLGFVIFSFPYPFAVLAYLVMVVIIPNNPQSTAEPLDQDYDQSEDQEE